MSTSYTVEDVAKTILSTENGGEMSPMKLQKLLYYAQSWALVWLQQPLFNNEFEAWTDGPVLPDFYEKYKDRYELTAEDITDGSVVQEPAIARTIRSVLQFYGRKTDDELRDLTQVEDPWRSARGDHPSNVALNDAIISKASMLDYYRQLGERAEFVA